MSSHNPVVVLIPGSFGSAACYSRMKPFLKGYEFVDVAFPSADPEDALSVTCQRDITHVRDAFMQPLIDEGKDVVVVVHSYGGVLSACCKGLDKVTRASRGQRGGVIGLVLICSNIVLENESVADAFVKLTGATEFDIPAWMKIDNPSPGKAIVDPLMETMYNDCDPSMESELQRLAKPQGYNVFLTPALAPCWADDGFEGRRCYIRCEKDQCIPVQAQDAWLTSCGVEWDVATFETGHMPFISQPEMTADRIEKWIQGFGLKPL